MNIDQIRRIVNTPDMPEDLARAEIIKALAGDKGAILAVLKLVNARVEADRELIAEMNLMLSKAHIGLEQKALNRGGFIQQEIKDFYEKWQGRVTHCFNR